MFCPKCGAQNADTNKFCLGCGAPLLAKPQVTPGLESKASAAQVSQPPAVDMAAGVAGAEGKACPLCARTYPASQKFCNADGATLVVNAAAPPALADEQQEFRRADPALVAAPAPTAPPLPAEPQAATAPEPSAAPPAAQLPHTPPTIEASAEGLACPACGLAFPLGVRFCDQDGTALASKSAEQAARTAASPQVLQRSEELSWDNEWEDLQEARRKRSYLVASLVALAVLIAGGGGYAYWNGNFDKWIGGKADPELSGALGKGSPTSDGTAGAKTAAPGLLGSYKAHLSDQDIVLVIEGESPKPLVASAGTVTYLNVVNGGTCTAALVPTNGGGVGGDTGNAVSFQQTPVLGKPNCPKDIPVKMDITGQPADTNGVIRSIAIEWQSPNSSKVLMAGNLEREANQ